MAAISKKCLFFLLAVLVVLGGGFLLYRGFFLYLDSAFPQTKCEAARHLDFPEQYADCVTCHERTTAEITQDWKESKHGIMLVKCVVCHGEPDGTGAVPFAAKPDPERICSQCHDPAMKSMTEKYGELLDCNTCHPHHQNSMHGRAYENKTASGKTTF